MIFVLKNADFSNSGLGKIDVPYEPSAEALAVISKFASISDAKKTKVGFFIDTLKTAGILSKLNYLMLPCVASTASEAMQNVLLTTQSLPPASVGIINNGGLSFSGKGLITLTSYYKGSVDPSSCSFGVNAIVSTTNAATCDVLKASDGTAALRAYHNVADGTLSIGAGDSSKLFTFSGTGVSTVSGTTGKTIYNGSIRSIDGITGYGTTPKLTLSSGTEATSGAYHAWFNGVIKCIFVGAALTDTEMLAIKTAIDTLVA